MIRKADPEELPAICATMASMEPWKNLELSEERLLKAATNDPLRQTWVYAEAGEICGVIMFRDRHALQVLTNRGFDHELAKAFDKPDITHIPLPDGAYVNALAIFPASQNRNFGRLLLDHAEGAAAHLGRIYLCVSDSNTRARRFYERNGYHCIASINNCIQSGNVEHLMQKEL